MPDFTLVLGGGGVAGIAWQVGLLAGLEAAEVDVRAASAILGTSAGSTVAAQLASDVPLAELYERQLAGVEYEISRGLSGGSLLSYVLAQALPGDSTAVGRRVGRRAIKANPGYETERHRVIEARLPSHEWSKADLRIVAVNATTGRHRVLTRDDGIPLVDAVEASCAIPMVWPPVQLDDGLYIDGGTRSPVNLDLAPGHGAVIVLAPVAIAFRRSTSLAAQRAALGSRPVEIVSMSAPAKSAQGRNSLDSSVVPAVARAGFDQAATEVTRIRVALGEGPGTR